MSRQHSTTSNYSMPNYERDPSPDYASRPSEEQPFENSKPRGGTRKVIGDTESQKLPEIETLHIDFGRTQRLTPENSEPSHSRSNSRPASRPTTATGRRSPFDALGWPETSSHRSSLYDPYGSVSAGRKSPLNPNPTTPPHRTPETQSPNSRPSFSRPVSQAWYPGAQIAGGQQEGLSAEEFVQQRHALAMNTRNYVPIRAYSAGRVEQVKSNQLQQAPPSPQTKSPRKLQKRRTESRNESRNSSGNSVDYSAYLSAREQEHVAKMTGGPLLNMSNAQSRVPDPKVGLIGAISAREQERRAIKDGLQGQMVQAAIDQQRREVKNRQMQGMHQRSQSQYLMQQQYQDLVQNPYQSQTPYQSEYAFPVGSEYGTQQSPQTQQTYWNQMQSQYPQQASQWRPERPAPPQQTQSSQSMYTVQQQQGPLQGQAQSRVPRTHSAAVQQGYATPQYPPSMHARSQSAFSQYTGFYAPQR